MPSRKQAPCSSASSFLEIWDYLDVSGSRKDEELEKHQRTSMLTPHWPEANYMTISS
jgi:hypothetical protein